MRILAIFIILLISQKSVAQCDFTISVPQDITICQPENFNLDGVINGDYLSFEWTSTEGYTNTNDLGPNVPVSTTTTFTLQAAGVTTTNLIVNGDFSSGNSGFTSDYTNVPGNLNGLCQGCYNINSMTPALWNNCPPLDGDMMVVNGAPILNQNVWCQNVPINPNSQYVFSTWLQTIILPVPNLSFTINGVQIGNIFSGSSSTCDWQQFYTTWDSGSATSATICITNESSVQAGNDFSLDDIFFGPVCEDEASFTVTFEPFVLAPPHDAMIDCHQTSDTLIVIPVPSNASYTYIWSTQDGNITTDPTNETVSVDKGGNYIVTVTNSVSGCMQEQAFFVDEDFNVPEIEINGNLSLDCQNNITTLSFSSTLGIINSIWTLPSGVTVQASIVNTSLGGDYILNVEAANGCIGSDTVAVQLDNTQINYQALTSGPLSCEIHAVNIYLDILSALDSITWLGPSIDSISMKGDTIVVSAPGTYYYELHKGDNCSVTDSVVIQILAPQYQYQLPIPDTLTCSLPNVWLSLQNVQGIDNINWLDKDTIIGNGDSLMISKTGLYYVQVSDQNGCIKLDSLTILGDFNKPLFSVDVDSIDCINQFGQFIIDYPNEGTFLWQGQGVTSHLKNPTFSTAGFYHLLITAENGCQDSVDVFLPSSVGFPSIMADISQITCKNLTGKIILTSTQSSVFGWVDDLGNSGSSDTIYSNLPHAYTILVTADNGCSAMATYEITIDTISPVVNILLADQLTCDILTASPNVIASNYTKYVWKKDNVIIPSNTISPTFSKPGQYILELENANGCVTSTIYNVTQDTTKPNFIAFAEDLSCKSPTTELMISGDNGSSYFWTQNNQIINSGLIITQPQIITIRATNDQGCDSTFTFSINGNFEKPALNPLAVSLNCYTPSAWVKYDPIDPGLSYSWNTDFGIIISDSILISNAGNYALEATNSFGCTQTQKIEITVDKVEPSLEIMGDGMIKCSENSTKLIATSNIGQVQYQWMFQDQNVGIESNLVAVNEGTYSVVLTNITNGCTSNQTIQVNKQATPEVINFDLIQPNCFGEKGQFKIQQIINGTAPYHIIFNGQSIVQNIPIDLSTGSYDVLVTDANGCMIDTNFTIANVDDFSVNAGPDGTIGKNEIYQIMASSDKIWSEINHITWNPSNSLSCDDCPNPMANPVTDTEYTIEILDKNGCIREDKVWVRVKTQTGYTYPNIIYPLSSQGNNYFTIFPLYQSIASIITLNIYDRWGNHIFNTKNIKAGDPSLGWDGTYLSQEVVQGVYVWVAQLLMIDGNLITISGDITVVH